MTRNMSQRRIFIAIGLIAAFAALSGCGFKPIYATTAEEGGSALVHRIAVQRVTAPSTDLEADIIRALESRMPPTPGVSPQYLLTVTTKISAIPLAVQIDASTTRFNYRLTGRYRLVDTNSGDVIGGGASADTSFNIVRSQYSNLVAENAVREKAAQLLAVEIERDILRKIAEGKSQDGETETDDPDELDLDADGFFVEPDETY